MNFGSTAYGGGDRSIVRRRIEENKLAALQTAVQKNFHLGSVAKWEQSSSKLICHKQQQRAQLELEKQNKLDLEIRKSKLRRLLAEEEIIFRKEIDNKSESAQEKRARLEQRAKELKTKRIARREAFVAKQRLKQFRDSCDELRLNAGQNLTMECDRIRKQQMSEKRLRKEYETLENDKYLNIWKNELQKKIDREARETEYKNNLNDDTAKAIKQQMAQLEAKRQEEKQLKQKEIAQRVNQLCEAEEKKRLESVAKLQDLEAKRSEMMHEYKMFERRKKEEAAAERAKDEAFISRVLAEQKEEDQEKAGEQQQNKENITNYLAYLNALKEKEAENDRLLEKLRQRELEAAWNKREMGWKKEEMARRQLLANVVDGRKDQIAYKENQREKSSNEDTVDARRMMKQMEAYEAEESAKMEQRTEYNKTIQNFLKLQIADKQKEDAQKKDNVAFEMDADKKRQEYNQLLKQETKKDRHALQQGKTQHHFPKTTANWYSY